MVSRTDGSESYRMSDFTSGEIKVAMDQGVRKGSSDRWKERWMSQAMERGASFGSGSHRMSD